MKLVLFLVALLSVLEAHGEDAATERPREFPRNDCNYTATPTSCFMSGAEFMDQYCRAAYLRASAESGAGVKRYEDVLREVASCAKNAEAFLDPMYKETARKRKGKAAAAIKDFYAAQLASLRGIVPSGGESRFAYESRQATTLQGLREKKARLELEIK